MKYYLILIIAAGFILFSGSRFDSMVQASEHSAPPAGISKSLFFEARTGIIRGKIFLLQKQRDNGSWNDRTQDTALAIIALLKAEQFHSSSSVDEAVAAGVEYLLNSAHDDGAIYNDEAKESPVKATAISILSLKKAGAAADSELILRARRYLLSVQERGGEIDNQEDAGGFPPRAGEKPEIIVTDWVLEALLATDYLLLPSDEKENREEKNRKQIITEMLPVYKKALGFVERCYAGRNSNQEAEIRPACFAAFPSKIINGGKKEETLAEDLRLSLVGTKLVLYTRNGGDSRFLIPALSWLRNNWPENSLPENGKMYETGFYLTQVMGLLEKMEETSRESNVFSKWRRYTVLDILDNQQGHGGWPDERLENNENFLGGVVSTSYALLALLGAL